MYQYKCPKCGNTFTTPAQVNSVTCPYCGERFSTVYGQQQTPPQYGFGQYQQQPYPQQVGVFDCGPSGKSRGVAALLAFFLGGFGAHYFYLNKISGGFICILLCLVTCGLWSVIILIQAIMLLCMSSEEFEAKYVNTPSGFPIF